MKQESIMFAYSNHGIVIKHHSICCDIHLDSQGLIKPEEFNQIRTKIQKYNKDTIMILDSCLEASKTIQYNFVQECGVFDKFKNIAELDENNCMKITGWAKLQFIAFSNYITRVRDTSGRTKEQLIAIYRYWLSKGIDQCSLAMLKSNTTQQQISHYLSQIREAINRDFVPLFLGAKNTLKSGLYFLIIF